MVAPAGYGKTTVLAQWAERDDRPFAWVSCDAEDDVRRLCMRIASALDRSGSLEGPVLASIRGRRSPAVALRELVAAFVSLRHPVVLALDGAHLIRKKGCADVVASLALHVPDGSTVALAGRALPRGPIARLRAGGGVFEVGSEELALTRRETERLVRGLGVELEAEELDELTERAEGWPTGVYLAALALKDGGAGASMPGGDDRFVTDYLDFELLTRLGANDVRFLTRTSVLDSMCGPLCDTVLESEGSGRKLETLDKANLFLVPLDHRRWSYRYHREFRDFLRAELERREPAIVPVLCRRASVWCEEHGEPEAAIAYAHAAGDIDRLASLVGRHTLAAWAAGKRETVDRWLGWFDESCDLERHPEIAVLEAWAHGVAGRPSLSERWLALAERATLREPLPDGSASIEPWLAVVRAMHCAGGVPQMQADAELALRELGPASGWRPAALVLRGAAHLLLGEDDAADAAMADAAEEAESIGVLPSRIVAISERSLLAAARGDDANAGALAREARALVEEHGLEAHVRCALAFAVSARREAQLGSLDRAKRELALARSLEPQLIRTLPWYSVQAALELAQVHLSILDAAGAEGVARRGRRDPSPPPRPRRPRRPAGRARRAGRTGGGGSGREGVHADLRRASPAPASVHVPLLPGDRGATVHLAEHGQDSGDLRLSQARRLVAKRRDRARGRARARRAFLLVRRFHPCGVMPPGLGRSGMPLLPWTIRASPFVSSQFTMTPTSDRSSRADCGTLSHRASMRRRKRWCALGRSSR